MELDGNVIEKLKVRLKKLESPEKRQKRNDREFKMEFLNKVSHQRKKSTRIV